MSLERELDGSWERTSQIPMRSLHPEVPLGIFGSRDWICVLSSESCLKAGGFRVLSPPFHSYCGDHKVKGRVPSFPLCQLDATDYLGHTMSQGSNRREGRLPGERQHDLKYAFIGVLGGWEKYCELRSLKLLATSSPQRGKPAYSSFPTQHPWDMQISSSASDLLANRPAGSMEGTQGHDMMAHSQPQASWHSPDGFSSPDTQEDAVLSQGQDHEPFIKAAST